MMEVALGVLLLATAGWAREIQRDVGIKLVNGTYASPGQFPFTVALQKADTDEFHCGAALVAPGWLLTAATCSVWYEPSYLKVILGVHDFDDLENGGGQPELNTVEEIVVHPRFAGGTAYHFDVALLRLTTPANMDNPFIETAVLADEGEDYTESECYILGWGAQYPLGPIGGILRYAKTNILTDEVCETLVTNVDLESLMCVRSGYNGPCYGDWGTPMVCNREGSMVMAGFNSAIYRDCEPENRSLYSRVSAVSDWVRTVIES